MGVNNSPKAAANRRPGVVISSLIGKGEQVGNRWGIPYKSYTIKNARTKSEQREKRRRLTRAREKIGPYFHKVQIAEIGSDPTKTHFFWEKFLRPAVGLYTEGVGGRPILRGIRAAGYPSPWVGGGGDVLAFAEIFG